MSKYIKYFIIIPFINTFFTQAQEVSKVWDLKTAIAYDITISITQAYLNILLARENITYLKDLLTTSEAKVKQSEQQFKFGTIAKKDLLQLQATYANDK